MMRLTLLFLFMGFLEFSCAQSNLVSLCEGLAARNAMPQIIQQTLGTPTNKRTVGHFAHGLGGGYSHYQIHYWQYDPQMLIVVFQLFPPDSTRQDSFARIGYILSDPLLMVQMGFSAKLKQIPANSSWHYQEYLANRISGTKVVGSRCYTVGQGGYELFYRKRLLGRYQLVAVSF